MKDSGPTDERSLIVGCANGDRKAQYQMYRQYYGAMMPVCKRYAANEDEAAEILNDSFLKLFSLLEESNEEVRSLKALIKRIVINTAIDHFRRNKRHHATETLESERYGGVDSVNVMDEMAADEIIAQIQQLPQTMRTVFNLCVIEGYSHKEASEKMGIGEGTSRSYLAKAKLKLQKRIAAQYPQYQKPHARKLGS